MPALVSLTGVAVGFAALAFITFYYVLPWWFNRGPDILPDNAIPAHDILNREPGHDRDIWPVGFPHEAPERPFSVVVAHKTMQTHSGCALEDCPRKRAAFKTLYDAGELTPDPRSERWIR